MTNVSKINNQPAIGNDSISQMMRMACEDAIKGVLQISDVSPRRLMNISEAAVYLSLSERELYNMFSTKELTAVRHGRRVLVDIRDLEAWIEARKAA